MDDAAGDETQETAQPTGTLAPIALGLGVAGLAMGLIPFYGSFLALPMCVVAIVLGLVARGRAWESRRQATIGAVTGGIGILLVAGWAGLFFWRMSGYGSVTSEVAVDVGVSQGVGSVEVESQPSPEGSPTPGDDPTGADGPTAVGPGEAGAGLVTGLTGEAEVSIDGEAFTVDLDDCAIAERTSTQVLVRGMGPDGRLGVGAPDTSGGMVLVLEIQDGPEATLLGTVQGMSSRGRGGGFLTDRRQFAIEGVMRDLHTGDAVDVSLTVTCS